LFTHRDGTGAWFAISTLNLGAQIAKDGAPNSIQGRHDAN
jgi:hypothetical protein